MHGLEYGFNSLEEHVEDTMKQKFWQIVVWLKQKQDIMLTMVGIKPEFDTLMIATEVLQRVDQYTLNSLVTDINKGLPVDIVKSLPRYPISWHMASQHEKFIYLSLTQWLCKKYVEREIKDLDIDTQEVCSESLAFIKEHGITIGIKTRETLFTFLLHSAELLSF